MSVITISFLSAGLISLIGGVGIIFVANIGTTTGAWLVAGFGLKINIAAYAMPMIALSIVLVFQKSMQLRGVGYALRDASAASSLVGEGQLRAAEPTESAFPF